MIQKRQNKFGYVRDSKADSRSSFSYSVYPDLRPNLSDVGEGMFRFLTIDPCAFSEKTTSTAEVPERRLCRALLVDAVEIVTVRKKGRDKQVAREDARLWFLGRLPRTVLTFRYCCDVLGLDRSYFLRKLREVCDLEPRRRRAA